MKFTIKPLFNGLSDHDAQILIFHNLKIQNPKHQYSMKRVTYETTIAQFKINLSYESWSDILMIVMLIQFLIVLSTPI